MTERPADRIARLGAEIEAARARAAEERDFEWAEVGDVIDAMSHELNDITRLYANDHEAAHGRLNDLEGRLAEVNARLTGKAD
jgi:hypothetical protein